MNPTPVAWMTISELKAIVSRSHTITFAKRMRRASENEILEEMLAGLTEHIAPRLQQARAEATLQGKVSALREAAENVDSCGYISVEHLNRIADSIENATEMEKGK